MRSPFFAFLALAALSSPAHGSTVVTEHARTRLIAEATGVAPGGTVALALAQDVQEGWHVYWKNPGDSGLPLDFVWTLPDGAATTGIDYPTPRRIAIGQLVNFGHEGAPTFLTSVTVPDNATVGSLLEIGLEATWLICADICVPETGTFQISIPIVDAPQTDDATALIFADARSALPTPLPGDAYFSVNGKTLDLDLPDIKSAGGVYFFPDTEGLSEPAAAQDAKRKNGRLLISVKGGPALAQIGERVGGVVAVDNDGATAGYSLVAERRGGGAARGAANGSFGGFLAAAFFGGALLNLMPCVFPILFIKAASMAEAANARSGTLRRHGLFYALGVVATFAGLGGLLLALRAGGAGLGWGYQLQSPVVIALSAYLLFAVGLNLAGAFHVGSSLQNVGSGLVAGKNGDMTAFLTGVLAVFVAAPCVGPFLTAPVGAAAILPPVSGMAIFMAMGLGLAAPYVALSFVPGARRLLPKPGPWMERFRQALSFPVFAAAAYFVWVLAAQTGARGLAFGLTGVLLVALAARLWEWGRTARWRSAAAAVALIAAIGPVVMLKPSEAAAPSVGTIAFDPADIASRRAAGEAIFIDFTAAWCVTCQVNRLTVFSSPKVKQAFAENAIVFVTADWTRRDETIANALSEFGANGVPLYIYYPRGGEAIVLPQPLTERSLLAVIDPATKGVS